MRRFIVYHRIKPDFISEPDVIHSKDFECIAMVKAENLEHVFQVTNTIDREWWLNPEIKSFVSGRDGFRSTSVGDAIAEFPLDFKGPTKTHLVCVCGFKKVVFCYDEDKLQREAEAAGYGDSQIRPKKSLRNIEDVYPKCKIYR